MTKNKKSYERKTIACTLCNIKTIWASRAAFFWSATLNNDNESITRYFKFGLNWSKIV